VHVKRGLILNLMPEVFDKPNSKSKIIPLSVAALGVAFGDIATSPLYAINQIFFGHGQVAQDSSNIVGAISLAVWALLIVVSFKYLIFVLRADNDGQGGVFALFGILRRHGKKTEWLLPGLLMLAAGMLFGGGMITPAISVLAAVEGLKVYTHLVDPYIVTVTVFILVGLFAVQHHGTSKVGAIFGPIVIIWLLAIGLLGLRQVIFHPEILNALDPRLGIQFLIKLGISRSLLVLGMVMLVITGAEALYADLGHFGRGPIRLSWFALVLPCLELNYLGQGAYLLSREQVIGGNIFFSMVPASLLIPMVGLATMATIIASQALISGAFSLTMQGVGLGLFPRMRITHTHEEHHGQIYVGFTNWIMCLGCIGLVYAFKSSSALAVAYGLAVSADMLVTSMTMVAVARRQWRWPSFSSFALFGSLAAIDLCFLTANSLNFLDGGFVPVLVGIFMFLVMRSWVWGRRASVRAYHSETTLLMSKVIELKRESRITLERTVILMCPKAITHSNEHAPVILQTYIERYGILPKNVILLDVIQLPVPYVHSNRCHVRTFFDSPTAGSISGVSVHFGFMEEPKVENVLKELAITHQLSLTAFPHDWHVHASTERLLPAAGISALRRLKLRIYLFLRRNSLAAYYYFGMGTDIRLSIDVFPLRVK
jgi:KUP system potassium uptake protein